MELASYVDAMELASYVDAMELASYVDAMEPHKYTIKFPLPQSIHRVTLDQTSSEREYSLIVFSIRVFSCILIMY
jgi:hypothetical protein